MINNIPVDRKDEIELLNEKIAALQTALNNKKGIGINVSRGIIKTLNGTTSGASYTLTEDCWMKVSMSAIGLGYYAKVYVDGTEWKSQAGGYSEAYTQSFDMFVKKGQVVKAQITTPSTETYVKCEFYGMK